MQQELAEVKQTVGSLTREQMAIAYKWNDGAGTYSPPGHWKDHGRRIGGYTVTFARQDGAD